MTAPGKILFDYRRENQIKESKSKKVEKEIVSVTSDLMLRGVLGPPMAAAAATPAAPAAPAAPQFPPPPLAGELLLLAWLFP